MSSPTERYQQYICPDDFQERLTEIGGVNRYDEPNFRIVWSQGGGDYSVYRAGASWTPEGQPTYTGYRDLLIGGGIPCWAIIQWHDGLEYGTPEMYYVQNYDADTHLQTLGEYPYSGRYQLLYNLRWTERRGSRLHFEAMPLNALLLDMIVPIVTAAKDIGVEKVRAAVQDIKDREDAADLDTIEDAMRSSALAFRGNPVSYQKQGCRTALIDKKIESMQKNWNAMMTRASKLGRGLTQSEVPI